jgi:hypothetical protein
MNFTQVTGMQQKISRAPLILGAERSHSGFLVVEEIGKPFHLPIKGTPSVHFKHSSSARSFKVNA